MAAHSSSIDRVPRKRRRDTRVDRATNPRQGA